MGFLLLSIETLTTIGFGTSYPLHTCGGHVWMVMMLETLANVTINGALITAVYVKVTRPLTKDSTRLFSRQAVVNKTKRYINVPFNALFLYFRFVKGMKPCALFFE